MKIDDLYKLFLDHPKICTDTRILEPNSLFFALKGERFDGNIFAGKALEVCKYAVVDDPNVVKGESYILVDDVLSALQALAQKHRESISIPIIAITGTNGKTTTKELMASVLQTEFNTYATKGNLNNHIGVPLSILEIPLDCQMAIIEMGANKVGDIMELCQIAKPTHGVITNVGKAHLEGFGSFENIMRAKGELYDYLYVNGGTAFVNYDNEYLEDMNPPRKTIHYGVSRFTHCQGQIIKETPFLSFRWISTEELLYDDSELDWSASERAIQLKLVGKYNFENALAAVCVANFFNVDDIHIKNALEKYEPHNNRSQLLETATNKLIVDCYNANPTSMRLAIEVFLKFEGDSKIMILGDMLELGKVSTREHDVLTHYIADLPSIKYVYFVGGEFRSVADETKNFRWFSDVEELINFLQSSPIKNSTVLIKGSRGITLEKVLPVLHA
ncbi:MAG: UDP-N-acetylmuramoyl-tripeptide--D-alanyl-D-alanine ligase [Salinivirgaceae bacterium]|jgi:UDP-N-acetylmuramoyl-tripeptide--D-alanyl-D-alanine ligase|nr:UDP-N-acetylmuramoyl-tripeptide--D-alanyl-D-alanine ligase [Salinivirgaceae bacterium]